MLHTVWIKRWYLKMAHSNQKFPMGHFSHYMVGSWIEQLKDLSKSFSTFELRAALAERGYRISTQLLGILVIRYASGDGSSICKSCDILSLSSWIAGPWSSRDRRSVVRSGHPWLVTSFLHVQDESFLDNFTVFCHGIIWYDSYFGRMISLILKGSVLKSTKIFEASVRWFSTEDVTLLIVDMSLNITLWALSFGRFWELTLLVIFLIQSLTFCDHNINDPIVRWNDCILIRFRSYGNKTSKCTQKLQKNTGWDFSYHTHTGPIPHSYHTRTTLASTTYYIRITHILNPNYTRTTHILHLYCTHTTPVPHP